MPLFFSMLLRVMTKERHGSSSMPSACLGHASKQHAISQTRLGRNESNTLLALPDRHSTKLRSALSVFHLNTPSATPSSHIQPLTACPPSSSGKGKDGRDESAPMKGER